MTVSSVLRPTSNNNAIYNNNFIDNTNQAWVREGTGNIFNLEKPTGGNYWSNFDTPAEGCYDANNDGFCDDPYYFYGGVDYLPWAKQSGWEVPVDTISPTTTVTLSGTLGNNDWYISNVQVTLTAVDNEGGSGVQKTEYSFDGTTWNTYSAPFTITNEGTTTVYYKSTDNAGNVETTKSMTVKIDKTPPEITITGVSDGATYLLCAVPTPGYEVTDATSGVATSSATLTGGNANGVGTFTYKVTATDMAGNISIKTVTYKVTYSFDGFQPPVTLGKPFKYGSTIPVKFILTDGCGNIVSTAFATLMLQLYSAGEPVGDSIDATSNVPDSGNLFRFSESYYIYNLLTGNLQEGTWLATVTLDDGKKYSIFIGIK